MSMKKAAVIGWPIRHSKSPIIHNHWLEKHRIQGSYEAIAISSEDLKAQVRALVEAGYCGFNVTAPHKQAIIPLMDFVRAEAERIGAVNTVVVNPDGTLEGRNTDSFGFIINLKENSKIFDSKKPIVVLGAGGAARAVVYALQKDGATDIRIVNRTLARAKELAAMFGGTSGHPWELLPDLLKDTALLVNTTSLGMTGQPALDIDLNPLPKTALVHDIVYHPLKTGLLQTAAGRGNPIVTGLGMLLHQARPAFQAWFGVMPDVDADLMKKVLA